jgi:hypothetical protein
MREVSLEQLYKDISVGRTVAAERVRAEKKPDPVVALKAPLKAHEGYSFFYCGLLYGFCRLDSSITERFREQSNSSLKTYQVLFENPLFVLPWFPDFTKTRVSRLMQFTLESPQQKELFEFICSQVIVDRVRKQVWGVKMQTVKLPDPVSVDLKEMPEPVQITAFVPYRWDLGFEIRSKSTMFVGTPEVYQVNLGDLAFKQKSEELLGKQQ